jgi:hypothetical protein
MILVVKLLTVNKRGWEHEKVSKISGHMLAGCELGPSDSTAKQIFSFRELS